MILHFQVDADGVLVCHSGQQADFHSLVYGRSAFEWRGIGFEKTQSTAELFPQCRRDGQSGAGQNQHSSHDGDDPPPQPFFAPGLGRQFPQALLQPLLKVLRNGAVLYPCTPFHLGVKVLPIKIHMLPPPAAALSDVPALGSAGILPFPGQCPKSWRSPPPACPRSSRTSQPAASPPAGAKPHPTDRMAPGAAHSLRHGSDRPYRPPAAGFAAGRRHS